LGKGILYLIRVNYGGSLGKIFGVWGFGNTFSFWGAPLSGDLRGLKGGCPKGGLSAEKRGERFLPRGEIWSRKGGF